MQNSKFCSPAFHQLLPKWILIIVAFPCSTSFSRSPYLRWMLPSWRQRVHFSILNHPHPREEQRCKHANGYPCAFLKWNVLKAFGDPASPSETTGSTTTKGGKNDQMTPLFAKLGASHDAWQLHRQRTKAFIIQWLLGAFHFQKLPLG